MPFNCATLVDYQQIDCSTDKEFFSKVEGFAIFKEASRAKDLTLPATWDEYTGGTPVANIADDMVLVKSVEGEWDGGEPTVGVGFGDQLEQVESMKHTITLRGEYQKKNEAFINKVFRSSNAGIAFATGKRGELHVVQGTNATIIPKLETTNEQEKVRRFSLTITWTRLDFPNSIDASADAINLFYPS